MPPTWPGWFPCRNTEKVGGGKTIDGTNRHQGPGEFWADMEDIFHLE